MRVTYLNYGDFFKWWNNQKAGIPAYMVIDMVTQEVTVQRLEPVSYTHLDVYKRQDQRNGVDKQHKVKTTNSNTASSAQPKPTPGRGWSPAPTGAG